MDLVTSPGIFLIVKIKYASDSTKASYLSKGPLIAGEMDRVVHFEIPFDNKERAEKFYKQIFGWEMSNVSEMDYTFVNTVPVDGNQTPTEPGAINGGLTARNTPGETPVVVVSVSSIDDYIKRIEDNGGKLVVPKTTVGNMGLYARVSDTEGNVIGIWEDLPKS